MSYTLTGHLRNGKKKRRQHTKRKENNHLHMARFSNQHFIWKATARAWMRDTFCRMGKPNNVSRCYSCRLTNPPVQPATHNTHTPVVLRWQTVLFLLQVHVQLPTNVTAQRGDAYCSGVICKHDILICRTILNPLNDFSKVAVCCSFLQSSDGHLSPL